MTDLACPSCSIGAHSVSAPTVCGREKAFLQFHIKGWDASLSWQLKHDFWSMAPQMQPCKSRSAAAHIETCHRLLGVYYWLCPLTVWIIRGFILQGPVPKTLQTSMCPVAPASHSHVWQITVYTEAHFRSPPSSSERMWMERIKSVYSCLFMGVHLKPELKWEACVLCPNALRDAQQEGPVYICNICHVLCQPPHTSPISKTERGVAKQALCQPLWLLSAIWQYWSGFHIQDDWWLVIDYKNLEMGDLE